MIKAVRIPLEGKISQLQAIQSSKNKFIIKSVPTENYDDGSENKMLREVRKLLGENVHIDVKLVKSIPKEKSGKYRIIKSEVKK